MSFFRHEEIYHFDQGQSRKHRGGEGAILANHALAHRTDEFPAGYSSAGCSPAVPASASPAAAFIVGLIPYAKNLTANGILSLITLSQPWGSLHSRHFPILAVRTHLRTYKSEQKPGGEWLSIIAVGGCGCEYHRRRRVREPQDLVG